MALPAGHGIVRRSNHTVTAAGCCTSRRALDHCCCRAFAYSAGIWPWLLCCCALGPQCCTAAVQCCTGTSPLLALQGCTCAQTGSGAAATDAASVGRQVSASARRRRAYCNDKQPLPARIAPAVGKASTQMHAWRPQAHVAKDLAPWRPARHARLRPPCDDVPDIAPGAAEAGPLFQPHTKHPLDCFS
jgi:hypothetical protein